MTALDKQERLRVLYVEDDPALRGILATLIEARPDIQVVCATDSATAAVDFAEANEIDVALLDLALGEHQMTGIELGLALRRIRPHIGVVMLSQHRVPGYLARVDQAQRQGWSFILKRANLHPRYLVDVLQATHRGLNVVDPEMIDDESQSVEAELSATNRLTGRQRDVMALAAQGLDATAIATRLDVSANAIRQDLSRCYQILVPNPPAGADLRTLAVLRYLRETRSFMDGSK